jgi:uncharacterized membrane protein YhaH (DUF805 family)
MNWYFAVLKKYATFAGRARRREYWMFTLWNFIVCAILGIVATVALSISPKAALITDMVLLAYCLLTLLPALSVTVRRLHDTSRSGGWFWICLVPFVGPIVLLVFTLLDSAPGTNLYGPSPKAIKV